MIVSKFGSLIISTALLITSLILLAAPADTATYLVKLDSAPGELQLVLI